MSTREQILGGIRSGLGRGALGADRAAKLETRIRHPTVNLIPERSRLPHAAQVELFVRMAEAVSTSFSRVKSLPEVPGAVADYLARHNLPPRLRLSPDPALDQIPWNERPLLEIGRGRADPADLVSVTPCFAGIAETGTLMLASGAERPATLNFLPDNHIVVLKTKDVIGTYEEGFARLRQASGQPDADFMPRTVNFVTGPSRTADIELTLIMGAHGPRRLHVVLVDDEEA
ncbi:MAG TPA: lactate utilization protein [Candidatus Sulfotelmatobacter sp.]|nr:lactate utilization protein [Candidatus Sulfotelmatobacter sp.]